ncbi:MAG TPA: sugar phosphate nucleotidyltransferase [Prolixibacteraceae bacterium]|nr:sugar phosphate nucleotidyltransferase [Prolixibacteraceae bacterium]
MNRMETWKIDKALITSAGPDQRTLPLQTLIDKNRKKRTVLEIQIDEILSAGIDQVGLVIHPEDEDLFRKHLQVYAGKMQFIPQNEPLGYGHAILCATEFLGGEPFLHLVGDHLFLNQTGDNVALRVIHAAQEQQCAVSGVQQTRESLIGNFGTIGAERFQAASDLFRITKVVEKPVPSFAEHHLLVPGMRTGHYLCFFGVHVFSPALLPILQKQYQEAPTARLGLSDALHELARTTKYLALESNDWRFDIGQDYGLLKAQIALSLTGPDRDFLLTELLQFFLEREKRNND